MILLQDMLMRYNPVNLVLYNLTFSSESDLYRLFFFPPGNTASSVKFPMTPPMDLTQSISFRQHSDLEAPLVSCDVKTASHGLAQHALFNTGQGSLADRLGVNSLPT